jgi:outer membrane receptor for ferrienterochelin and colicin
MIGFEINADLKAREDLMLKVGYTYNNAEDKSPGQVTEDVTGVPEYTLNARLQYILPRLKSGIHMTMVKYGKSFRQLPTAMAPTNTVIENDRYTLFGIKITQPFLKKWEGYLTVSNIFDKDYEPESGYPAQGRNFWLGVSYKY